MKNLVKFVMLFFALTSYQCVEAAANTFAAKPIQIGDNVISILRRHGFSQKQRDQVLASSKGLRQVFLTLDTKYLVKQIPNGAELRIYDSQTSEAFRVLRQGATASVTPYKPAYSVQVSKTEGRIYGSMLGSILAKIKSNWIASRFMDAYVFDMEHSRDVARGARFSLTFERLSEAGQFIKYGEVLETSLEIDGELVRKRFIRRNNAGIFFSSKDLLEQRPFYAPVEYIKVASRFKPNRLHPITKRLQPHLGIDFELPVGDPVFAPRHGTVVRYGHNRAAGNYIVLLHSNGMETSYNHLNRVDRRIRQGLRVNAGEKIGEVGCTGYCTRPHLHFAVKKKGRMVDPVKYIKAYPSQMEQWLEERVAVN